MQMHIALLMNSFPNEAYLVEEPNNSDHISSFLFILIVHNDFQPYLGESE